MDFENDFENAVRSQFEAGKGVIALSVNMPDSLLLHVIRQAAAYGKPFTVFPSLTFSAEGIKKTNLQNTQESLTLSASEDDSFSRQSEPTQMTVEQLHAKISQLSDEMDANDEENAAMQKSIDAMYTQIDAMPKVSGD